MHRILAPWMHYLDVEKGGVATAMGDLYPPWEGARALLLNHRNPYGPEVSHEIQKAFYGHAISPANPVLGEWPKNEQRFAYPVYTVFILAPTIFANFAELRLWAQFALGLLTAISVWLWLDILRWRLPWEGVTAIILFTLSSPQIVQGLRLDQLGLLVGFFLAAGTWLVTRRHFTSAGVLLALSTIKPQMALLPLCWFAIWTCGNWPRRRRLAAAFVTAVGTLLAASELILPGWFRYFLAGIAAYRRYAPSWSLLHLALGEALGEIVGAVLILVLLLFAWRMRKEAAESRRFTTALAAFLMVTALTFPLFIPFNQVLLILPAMLLVQDWSALPRFSRIVFMVCIGWPWIISSVLLPFPPRLDPPNQAPLLPSFLVLFVPVLLPLLLMTRRNDAAGSHIPPVVSHAASP